ncbi:hypothetical protein PF003_g29796 [Phytophthora fragariae]|nr:hypothetical protein PF003_g29796 [Phytophthora fragariae]
MTVAERGEHLTPRRGVEPVRMTAAMKAFATDLAAQGLKPSRIRNGMMTRFSLDHETLPSLQVAQRFVNHYTRSRLRNNDFIDEATNDIWEAGFTGGEADDAPFTFSWRMTADGKPWVGRGTDEDPFLVGISTKNLLRKAERDPASFILHMDATFKLSQAWYPVFVVGVSDSNPTFHLLAIFISSQQKEEHYTEALCALRRVYMQVVNTPMKVLYVMGDAEDAQWNALQNAFGADNKFTTLMCYFHVAAKVYERTRHLPTETGHLVMRGLQDMHFPRDEAHYLETKEKVLSKWGKKLELATFIKYFSKRWLTGKFEQWQSFRTPRGFATTNNPAEQFNRALKRDYTLHRRLKMGVLLVQLSACCKHESINARQFVITTAPTAALKRRMHELRRQGLIYEHVPTRSNVAFLLNDAEITGEVVYVFQQASVRVYDPELKRTREALPVTAQLSYHTGRMELNEMPPTGWAVDVSTGRCPCLYNMKYAACVHSLIAMHDRAHTGERERFCYRGPGREAGQSAQAAGKPMNNRQALDDERS